mgnify:CR=1 FL=1
MKNLSESIEYTKEKKYHQITKLESHYSGSLKDLNLFLNGEKPITRVGSSFEYLSYWYLWQFNYQFTSKYQVDFSLLSQSTTFAIESNNVDFFLGKKIPAVDFAIPFTDAIKHCGQAIILGWDDEGKAYLNLLLKMLYGKQYKGWHEYTLHPWFMLELLCKWQGIELERDRLKMPKSLDVYQVALDHWDTTDESVLHDAIKQMAEYHIAESDEYVTTDEYGGEDSAQFDNADYFVFAVEIVLWLAIRQRLGLKDYQPDNELMKLAINQLPVESVPIPKIEIIEQCKAKIQAENPTIAFEM